MNFHRSLGVLQCCPRRGPSIILTAAFYFGELLETCGEIGSMWWSSPGWRTETEHTRACSCAMARRSGSCE